MARYAREDLDRIREATDFVQLIEQRVELRRAGPSRMTGLCPFHDERTPSFSVNVDEKLFHCFGCGEGGDIFRYIELTEGVDFPDAVTLLADRAGIELKTEEEDPQTAARRKRERRLLELLDRTNRFFERLLQLDRGIHPLFVARRLATHDLLQLVALGGELLRQLRALRFAVDH